MEISMDYLNFYLQKQNKTKQNPKKNMTFNKVL